MKNILVVLVTLGMVYAYWYPVPEKAPVAAPTPVLAPPPAPERKPFVAYRSPLDEPASRVGHRSETQTPVLLGNENTNYPHP